MGWWMIGLVMDRVWRETGLVDDGPEMMVGFYGLEEHMVFEGIELKDLEDELEGHWVVSPLWILCCARLLLSVFLARIPTTFPLFQTPAVNLRI